MKLLGLTGGIGMGKSTTAAACLRAGVQVVDTDDLARAVVQPGQPALAEIRDEFGGDLLDADGRLRRDQLGAIVFSNDGARRRLEGILHPRIRSLWSATVGQWRKRGFEAGVVVIPLLFESGVEATFDAVICVACTAVTQRDRLQQRGWSSEEIFRRIHTQWPIERKMAEARYVIWNEGGLDVLNGQLRAVLSEAIEQPSSQ